MTGFKIKITSFDGRITYLDMSDADIERANKMYGHVDTTSKLNKPILSADAAIVQMLNQLKKHINEFW